MTLETIGPVQRREFLKLAGATAVLGLTGAASAGSPSHIAILLDSADRDASGAPARRAAERLQKALTLKGAKCEVVSSQQAVAGAELCVVVAPNRSELAKGFQGASRSQMLPESVVLAPGHIRRTPALLVSGSGQQGFVYGLLELAERVEFGDDSNSALHLNQAIADSPANKVRQVSRYFCSELEDKPWYYDKDFWTEYLDLIVASRFNRFTLAYGLEYDFPRGVTDDYLHFPYPYLVEVPGFREVRVTQLATPDGKKLAAPVPLSSDERDKNMDILRFVAQETGARGLHFQLGIWTHAYEWTDSPNAYHHIDGLTPETHAAYCRDALAILLKECPEIQGLTMRVHGESGIPEGSFPFWKTLFEAISGCGRKVEIDMHAKGVNQTMIDIAVATGMPVKLGAKYSAEHQSLGYNQADIRALEVPKSGEAGKGPFSLSGGARLFTRYGYADFLQEGSKTDLLFRLWPGTQRHLLSADPEMCAAYGRTAHFCGATGIDLMEPLTFKGREGSGHPGGRCAYADKSLNPKTDWEKFEYYYRLWGRHLYNPDVEPEVWRRYLRREFGSGAEQLEAALANASRLLPLVTSSHLTSASNHAFWPELYYNMPIVIGSERSPYGDTPSPKCFGTVSPLDPQLFSTVVEHAQDLLDGNTNPKYSPIEVAQWLEGFAAASDEALRAARLKVGDPKAPAFRRIEEDVHIQNGLGQFFAAKLRSGVLYEVFCRGGNVEAGKLALSKYRSAREAWEKMAQRARGVYVEDVSYGDVPMRRGHWLDRLPDIDRDIAAMQKSLDAVPTSSAKPEAVTRALQAALAVQKRPAPHCHHAVPAGFHPGQELPLHLTRSNEPRGEMNERAKLFYRHVNQGERWISCDMERSGKAFEASIPAGYTESRFSLEYYFELRGNAGACFYPAFNTSLSNQPYFSLMRIP